MLAPCQPQLLPDLCHEQQVLIELSCLVEPCLLAGWGAAGDQGKPATWYANSSAWSRRR